MVYDQIGVSLFIAKDDVSLAIKDLQRHVDEFQGYIEHPESIEHHFSKGYRESQIVFYQEAIRLLKEEQS